MLKICCGEATDELVLDVHYATLNTVLIYDHDTNLPKVDAEGIPYAGPATQFKETLGIGLSFKL